MDKTSQILVRKKKKRSPGEEIFSNSDILIAVADFLDDRDLFAVVLVTKISCSLYSQG
jgi:hypothetical protein